MPLNREVVAFWTRTFRGQIRFSKSSRNGTYKSLEVLSVIIIDHVYSLKMVNLHKKMVFAQLLLLCLALQSTTSRYCEADYVRCICYIVDTKVAAIPNSANVVSLVVFILRRRARVISGHMTMCCEDSEPTSQASFKLYIHSTEYHSRILSTTRRQRCSQFCVFSTDF